MEGVRKTKGRQKIEIKKIESESDRIVTFSKRKAGIFKKATELATLTGTHVGIVIFSPAGKPFSFGSPSIDALVSRFMNEGNPLPPIGNTTQPIVEAHRLMRVRLLSQQYDELLSLLERENEVAKMLKQQMMEEANTQGNWWETSTDGLIEEELQKLCEKFGEKQKMIRDKLAKWNGFGASPSSYPPGPPPMNPFGSGFRGQI